MGDVRLILGDCLEAMREMAPGSVDAVVTDPPYGIGGDVVRSADKRVEAMPAWDVYSPAWIAEASRVCTDDATLAVFCDPRTIGSLWGCLQDAGFRPQQVAYWIKHAPPPNPRKGFQSAVETVVVARRGAAVWNGAGLTPNVWYEGPHKGIRSHPAEKPIGVMRWLVELLSVEGANVLDMHMGSGTTGVACLRTNRKFIGIEVVSTYFKIAETRIAEEQARHPLFDAPALTQTEAFS